MKKPNLVWLIFRKVIDRNKGFINKNRNETYLQKQYFFCYYLLLIVFKKCLKLNHLPS